MALLLNNLGTYTTIEQVWADHPEGGREGDYVVIGSSTYYWDKYSRCWVQSSAVPGQSGGGSQLIDGDLTVTGDLGVGGDAVINGRLIVNGQEVVPGAGGGDTGTAQLAFKSIVFKRSDGRPNAPTDGAFGNPVPNGWYDSVPQGTAPIWMSSRYFTSDNQRPAGVNNDNWNVWSTPALMSDTEDFDVEFSPAATTSVPTAPIDGVNTHGGSGDQLWFDPVLDPTANWSQMNWMATRSKYVNDSGNETWTQWKIILIKGEPGEAGNPGANGDGFRCVYAKAAANVTPTITSNGYPPSGNVTWKTSVSQLTLNAGDILWMAEMRCRAGVWDDSWSTPIRISGTNGQNGQNGQNGEPGADGADIEFIYKRSNSLPGVSDTAPASVNTDDDVPTGWSDNPVGVGTVNGVFAKYEWMCQRTKPAGTNQSWGPWVGPFVWSAYGDQGMDGDGLEYIYRRIEAGQSINSVIANPCYKYKTPSTSNPNVMQTHIVDNYRGGVYLDNGVWYPDGWDGSLGTFDGWSGGAYNGNGEWIPSGWTDDPKGVTSTYVKEYMSIRKRHNGSWGDWCAPALWAMYSEQHTVQIIDGEWWIDGVNTHVRAEGEAGTGVAIKGNADYLTSAQATADAAGLGGSPTSLQGITSSATLTVGDCYVVDYVDVSDASSANWVRGHIYVYNGSSSSTWSDKWTDLGQFRGEPGTSQYIHIAWATGVTKVSGAVSAVSDFETDYEDLDPTKSYDWMGICVDSNVGDDNNPLHYDWNYIKGVDGAFQEFVYIRTKNNANPGVETGNTDSNGHSNSQAEFLPCALAANVSAAQPELNASNNHYEYTDDPKTVDSEYRYCWMANRTKGSDGTWSAWSTPALWAVYAESQTYVDTGGIEQVVVNCDSTGHVKSAFSITFDCYLRYGSELCTLDSQNNSASFSGGGTITPSFDPQDEDNEFEFGYDIAQNTVLTAGYITISLEGHDSAGVLRSAIKRVPVIVNREGAAGATGATLRFRGNWSDSETYVWNNQYRDCVKYNNTFWLVGVYGTSLHDQDGPGETQDQNDWTDIGNAKFFATELLLAENAAIDLLSGNVINLFNTAGNKTASINADQQGSYCIYYPPSEYNADGNKRMEFCYDGWIYYYNDDANNTIAWMLGQGGTIIKTVSVSMTPIQLSASTIRLIDYNFDGNDAAVTMATRYIFSNDQSANNGKVYTGAGLTNNEPSSGNSVVPDGTYAAAPVPLQDLSDPDNVVYYLPYVVISGGKITRRGEARLISA